MCALFLDPYDPRHDCLYRAYLAFTILGVIGALIGIVVIYLQTKATQESASAAKDAANAAKANADAVINAERAWVFVEIAPTGGSVTFGENWTMGAYSFGFSVDLVCRNEGKTIAWITEKRIALASVDIPPKDQQWEGIPIVETAPDERVVPSGDFASTHLVECADTLGEKTAIIYGLVKYRDIFDQPRYTRFGHRLTKDRRRWVPLTEYPAYHKQT